MPWYESVTLFFILVFTSFFELFVSESGGSSGPKSERV
jgi:hypothetical protein